MVFSPFRTALALVALAASAPALWAEDLLIEGNAALQAALQAGVEGDSLILAPGTYDAMDFREVPAPDVIRSADPDNPAVLLGLVAADVDGLRVENLVLDYRYAPGDSLEGSAFRFGGGTGLRITGNRFVGDTSRGRGPENDGFGFSRALSVAHIQHIVIEGNHVSNFHRGFSFVNVGHITVRGNEITQIRSDGMNFSQVHDVLIEGNHIHTFNRSVSSRDHADMIQFWTERTETASRNIVIRGNILNSGEGYYTQSIFMRNEAVDRRGAGREMFYQNVLIEENIILNAHLHGITVGETVGLTIRNNTVIQNPLSVTTAYPPDNSIWRPTIRVNADAVGVRVEDNLVFRVIGFEDQPGWRVARNLYIQNRSLMEPYHYSQIFQGYPQGDQGAVSTYIYNPEGSAGPPGIGASMLRQ